MFTFHEINDGRLEGRSIAVFKNGKPINADQRNALLQRLNRLGGLDNDDPVWDSARSGSRLRVAEMLDNHSEPSDATDSLRRLGAEVIRSLVRELAEAVPDRK